MAEKSDRSDTSGEAGGDQVGSSASQEFLARLTETHRELFDENRRILSFADYLELVRVRPELFARSAPQYVADAFDFFSTRDVSGIGGEIRRFALFDADFDPTVDRVVGTERAQNEIYRLLGNFVREGRVNRLILLHGPNGSAKSSLLACLMHALEAYSKEDEGALYRFHWVFPSERSEGKRIGFGETPGRRGSLESYAYLEEEEIDAKLPGEHNDNPLFLLPREDREAFLRDALNEASSGKPAMKLSETVVQGDLSHRSREVFDALMNTYRGDMAEVLRHVQVERFTISRRYRSGAVTVEPQLRVDAGVRQLTADRSLSALPVALQNKTLFEAYGPLVEGNRGVIEFNDIFKRPMEANKYLLATSEKGTVTLDTGIVHLDAILLATANEIYLEAFKGQADWASYKGRIELVRMPYLLDYRKEEEIYRDQIESLDLGKDIAPHTTFVAALWAVMTRLRRPDPDDFDEKIRPVIAELGPLEKARLYATGELPDGLSSEERKTLTAAIPALFRQGAELDEYEGRHGASPREMKALLLRAAHDGGDTMTPEHVFRGLRELLKDTTVYEWLRIKPDGPYHRPDEFIRMIREVYLQIVEREFWHATGLVDEEEYARLFNKYVSHANFWIRGESMEDPKTGQKIGPDEKMMEEVEEALGRTEEPKEFRSHLISKVAAFRIDHPDDDVDYRRIFPVYFERMRESYFDSKRAQVATIERNVLRYVDGDADRLETAEREQVEATLTSLQEEFGYSREAGKRAIAILVKERFGTYTKTS